MVKRAFSSFSFLSAFVSLLVLSAISPYLISFTAFMSPPSLLLSKSLYMVKKIFAYDTTALWSMNFLIKIKLKIKFQCADIYRLYRQNNISYDYIFVKEKDYFIETKVTKYVTFHLIKIFHCSYNQDDKTLL